MKLLFRIPTMVILAALLVMSCSESPLGMGDDLAGSESLSKGGPPDGKGGRPDNPGGKPGGETAGNNLSFPVIWSDGQDKALRSTDMGQMMFGGEFFMLVDPGNPDAGEQAWNIQNDPINEWCASYYDPLGASTSVDWIDWGDNLEAKDWRYGAKVRVETVLFEDILAGYPEMQGFRMMMDPASSTGRNEVWGTNGQLYVADQATIYTPNARLTIQKLNTAREDIPVLGDEYWDAVAGEWVDVDGTDYFGEVVFNGPAWLGGDGPGYYSAEINVKGKVIYGYNWDTRVTEAGPGDYRITFSLTNGTITDVVGAEILEPLPEEEVLSKLAEEGDDGGDTGGGIVAIDEAKNLTYIDVRLFEGGGGGGGGRP